MKNVKGMKHMKKGRLTTKRTKHTKGPGVSAGEARRGLRPLDEERMQIRNVTDRDGTVIRF